MKFWFKTLIKTLLICIILIAAFHFAAAQSPDNAVLADEVSEETTLSGSVTPRNYKGIVTQPQTSQPQYVYNQIQYIDTGTGTTGVSAPQAQTQTQTQTYTPPTATDGVTSSVGGEEEITPEINVW